MLVKSAENNSVILDDVVSSQIWNDALAEYGRSSKIDIGSLPKVRCLDEILGLIEVKQSHFSLRRHDGRRLDKIRSAIGKNFLPIQRMVEAVSFVANKAFPPAQAVFGAAKVLIEAAQKVSDGYDKISDGFRIMENYFDQLNVLKGKEITPGIRKAVLNVFLKTVIMLINSYQHISKGRTSLFVKNIFNEESSDLKPILQSYKEEIEQQRAIIETESYVNINALVKHTKTSDQKAENYHEISTNNMKNIDQKVTKLATQSSAQRKNVESEDLSKWLTELSFEESNHKFLKNRHKGTCAWLFQNNALQKWFAGDKEHILWCYGKAGAGKSTITSALVEHIKALIQTNVPEGALGGIKDAISYFFCDSQNEQTHSETELLSVICKSLVKYSSSFAEEVASLRQKVGGRPSEDDLSKLIQSSSKHFNRVFVLIDALDECPRSRRIKYAKLIEKLEPYVHFFITSRSNIDLGSLVGTPFSSIKIDDANRTDIESYLRFVVEEDTIFNDVLERKPEAKEEIINTIADRVEGMFLLAYYQIKDVCEQCTLEDVYGCLKSSLNSSVNDYYDKNLQRVEKLQDKAKLLTKRAIAYIHHAKRPLNVDEFCHALSIRDGDTEINLLRIPALNVLKNHSAGLIVFGENGTIGLVHLTLHEYFNEHPEKLGLELQADLASTCLVYLSFDTFSTGPCKDNNDLRARMQEYPFLEYAAHNVGYHLKQVSGYQNDERFQLIFEFLENSDKICSLLQVLFLPEYWTTRSYDRFPRYYSSLHVVVVLDMHELLPQICDNFSDLYRDGSGQLTPIEVAADRGHHISLKYVLDKGLSISRLKMYKVLKIAVTRGRYKAVKTLLTHRALTELLRCEDISKIFNFAVRRGHVDVVLSFWAVYSNDQPDLRNELDSFVLTIAEQGTVEIAQRILDWCSGNRKLLEKTLMCKAVSYGNREIWSMLFQMGVKFPDWKEVEAVRSKGRFAYFDRVFSDFSLTDHLLQHGMKANTETEDGATGLIVAADEDKEEVARLFLDNGVDIDASDDRGLTSLHYAAGRGYENLVKLLLKQGADPNLTNIEGSLKPLHVAALNNHRNVTQLLIDKTIGGKEIIDFVDRMAKENTPLCRLINPIKGPRTDRFNYYRGPLNYHSATYGRGQDLLEAGADIDTKDKNGYTPLFEAARDDDVETLEFLLANGAGVNKKNWADETALHASCRFGNSRSVSILLYDKAEVDAQAFVRTTPLLLAAENSNFSIVRYLAQRGADINWGDCYGRRAIHWCAAYGTRDDLQSLIREGADVNAQDYWRKTPLGWTVVHHVDEVFKETHILDSELLDSFSNIEVLLQTQAEINITSRDGCSALHYAVCSTPDETLRRLLSIEGIRVDLKAKGNFRPIDIAIMTGNLSTLKLLLKNGAEFMAEKHRCTIDFDFEEGYFWYYSNIHPSYVGESNMVLNNLIHFLSTKLLQYDWNNSETEVVYEAIIDESKDNETRSYFGSEESVSDHSWLRYVVHDESESSYEELLEGAGQVIGGEVKSLYKLASSEYEESDKEISGDRLASGDYAEGDEEKSADKLASGEYEESDEESLSTESSSSEISGEEQEAGKRLRHKIVNSFYVPRDLRTLCKGKNVKTEYTVLDLAIFSGNEEVRRLVEEDLSWILQSSVEMRKYDDW